VTVAQVAVGAMPPRSDAVVKTASPTTSMRRRPNTSPARPPRRSRPPKVRLYASTTHDSPAELKCSERWMGARAMFTTVASRTSMSWQVTRRVPPVCKPEGCSTEVREMGEAGAATRPRRADAQRNYERILSAARSAVEERGGDGRSGGRHQTSPRWSGCSIS